MKKMSIGITLIINIFTLSNLLNVAFARNQTITIGYAQSKIKYFKNIKGTHLQYHNELASPLGLLTSLTYLSGSENDSGIIHTDKSNLYYHSYNIKAKSYSLQIGPTYRMNSIASLYTTIGINHIKIKIKSDEQIAGIFYASNYSSEKETSFAYGTGIIINPITQLSLNIGYEGTRAKLDDNNINIHGFNFGIGYRF